MQHQRWNYRCKERVIFSKTNLHKPIWFNFVSVMFTLLRDVIHFWTSVIKWRLERCSDLNIVQVFWVAWWLCFVINKYKSYNVHIPWIFLLVSYFTEFRITWTLFLFLVHPSGIKIFTTSTKIVDMQRANNFLLNKHAQCTLKKSIGVNLVNIIIYP